MPKSRNRRRDVRKKQQKRAKNAKAAKRIAQLNAPIVTLEELAERTSRVADI